MAIVLGGAFLVMVAISTANLAAPSMRRTLGASFGQIQLVIAGYVLVYAVFLIAGGRLEDLYGRKLVLMAGTAIFTLGAAASGVAPSVPILVVARAAQGFGAALSTRSSWPSSRTRSRAATVTSRWACSAP